MTSPVNYLLIILFLFSSFAFGSGVVSVEGKLTSITETDYIVESAHTTYSVKRSSVPKSIAKEIDRPRGQVRFTVPFEAVNTLKRRQKK
ncbi:MAG: hypothetical protein H7301_03330 [Cryobacterium sp.]|nr:hypothetical protein [Oligoflexia bacterium]